jgi:hypothetical protein
MFSGIYFLLGVIATVFVYCGYLVYQVVKIDTDVSDIADYDDL